MPTVPRARHPRRTSETVVARAATMLLDLAAAEGMRRDALAEAAGLRQEDLALPDSRVPLSVQVALWQLIAKGIDDPGFGVRWGAAVRVRDLGLLGYVISYSATLGAALRRVAQYRHVIGPAVASALEISDPRHVALVEHHPAPGAELPPWTDFRLAAALSACRQITGVEIVPAEVAFAYDQPANTFEHRRFFRCPLRFGQSASKIIFLKQDMHLPVPRADETLAGYLSERAERELRSLLEGASMKHRVRSAIWAAMTGGRATLPHIASALRMPPRTLQRRLAEEGTSLQTEIEDVRRSMAMATLRDRSIPVEDVAFMLGYAEPSTFFRSFKRWTGTTPDRYRRSAAEHGAATR